MTLPMKAGVTAVAAVALGLALAGCGSDTKTAATTSSASTSSESSTTTSSTSSSAAPAAPAAGKNETIASYIKENGITETPVKRGDPGTPTVDLPVPAGWADAGPKTPDYAWGAIVFTDPWSGLAFNHPHAAVAVHADDENVAERFGVGKTSGVARVQEIKAAVRPHDLLIFAAPLFAELDEFVDREDWHGRDQDQDTPTAPGSR